MVSQYRVDFTQSAIAAAVAKASVTGVEDRARMVIDAGTFGGQPNGMFSFELAGQLFVATSQGNGVVRLDTAKHERLPASAFVGLDHYTPKGESDDH